MSSPLSIPLLINIGDVPYFSNDPLIKSNKLTLIPSTNMCVFDSERGKVRQTERVSSHHATPKDALN